MPPDPATTFQNIRNDFVHGNLDRAQLEVEKARQDFAATHADWPMKFRILEAEIQTYRGHRPEALELLTSPGVSFPVQGDLAIKRNLLCGLAHLRLGLPQQADAELQAARSLTNASNSSLNGEVLQTEAVAQLYRGHFPEATELSWKSLRVARAQRDLFLETSDLLNLGLIAINIRHYDEALSLLNEAATRARPIQARMLLEVVLGNTGVAYFYLGDFDKALSYFQQAGLEAQKTGTAGAQVDWLIDACSSYYRLGELGEARTCFEHSLKAAAAMDAPTEVADIDTHLAFVLYRQGLFDAAKMYNEQAILAARRAGKKPEEREALYLQALLASSPDHGKDSGHGSTQHPGQMLLQVYQQTTDDPALRGQIENALAKLYAGKHEARQADLWFRKSIQTFEGQRAAVMDEELRLPFSANGDTLYRDYADFLVASQKQEQALQLLDLGRARTLAGGLQQQSNDPTLKTSAVQAVSRPIDGTILFYSLGDAKSYLWAITRQHARLFVLPDKSTIATQIHAYQKAILKSSDPLKESNETARSLYATLVGPVAASIPKGSNVFIIPDGVLNGLNFETLLTPESGSRSHYWIEDVTISNANSISLLSRLNQQPARDYAKKLLLIGNPTTAGTGYEALVNGFAEIRGIENHFAPQTRTVITQSGAVPAAYAESQPQQFQFIHFVAHGTANRLNPLDSAVVLSPPPDHPEAYKLYARDIMRQPLKANLVTISACYGSGLRAYAGEGLVGLSWAFLRAGSHNVIGALWEVSDSSTPLLMDRLYGELEAGRSPDAALRTAKLSLIHSSAVYRKPLYWAGFQLYTGS